MPMPTRASGLHAVLLAAVSLVALTGCPSAAPSPCLIQRPPLQGYTIKFDLQGAAPAGCEAVLPTTFADNWRFDGFSDRQIWVKSDSIPYPPGDDGGPQSTVLGKGTFAEAPDPAKTAKTTPRPGPGRGQHLQHPRHDPVRR